MKWYSPVPKEFFIVTQGYLSEDWSLYPKFGHHSGVDYTCPRARDAARGSSDQANVPLFAVASGEIIYADTASSAWGQTLGNHLALYIPSAKCSFLYCHLLTPTEASGMSPFPKLGKIKANEKIGEMGDTGESHGLHLHLEAWRGRVDISKREFTSLDDIKQKTFDPDAFLRRKLQ